MKYIQAVIYWDIVAFASKITQNSYSKETNHPGLANGSSWVSQNCLTNFYAPRSLNFFCSRLRNDFEPFRM